MADLVAIATGNFTAAATWGLVDTTSKLVSTNTGTTALTTGNLDSATFTPGAITVAGVAIRLGSRASGAPANTITITLRNSTGSVDIASVTANVSDLPVSSAGNNNEGGWHYFKFNGTFLLVAATNYVIRATLSSTSTAVALCTNGTANNWQRLLVTTTTQAPAAGDDMYMAQTLDGAATPATVTARTVTMNQTAATDYGSGVVNLYQPGLSVSKACTLSYGIAAATNYLLRLSCTLSVFSGGTFNIGSSGSEIPRDSTAVLEFDNAADGQFGIRVLNLGTFNAYGLSRTAAKNQWKCLLTSTAAAAATTLNVDTDTGWLNGDEIGIAPTGRVRTELEARTLNANAGATSMTISAGLTNTHLGTGDYFAEVALLTRNVEIRSVTSTNACYHTFEATCIVFCSWIRWRYYSGLGGGGFWAINTTTGTLTQEFCVFRDGEQGVSVPNNSGGWTLNKCLFYVCSGGTTVSIGSTALTWTFTDIMFMGSNGNCVTFTDIGGTIGNVWCIAGGGSGITFAQTTLNNGTGGPTFSGGSTWTMHSNDGGAGAGMLNFTASQQDLTFPTLKMWRNATDPILLNSGLAMSNIEFTGDFFGIGVAGTEEPGLMRCADTNAISDLRFMNCNVSGDTLFQSNWGFLLDKKNSCAADVYFYNCVFSENTGTRRPFLVADIGGIPDIDSGGMTLQGIAEWCTFGAPTSVSFYYATGPQPKLATKNSYISCPGYGQVATAHRVYTAYGTFIRDTTVFDVAPASQNIRPIAGLTLGVDSNAFRRGTGFTAAVDSAGTITISVKVRIDGSYNGSTLPQLVLVKNRALGITADTVLDTHNGVAGVFDTLTATTAAAAADGMYEFIVRSYGTAGNVWVDTWSTSVSSPDTTGDKYWNGQPVTYPNTSSAAGGGGATSAAYVG
jgi:hypothetical protein